MPLRGTDFKHGFSGFPTSLIRYLCCQGDGSELRANDHSTDSIMNGSILCGKCGNEYPIVDGIVRFLSYDDLSVEGAHEAKLRDAQAESTNDLPVAQSVSLWNRLEMDPTLAALKLNDECTLLEFACGTGRYTMSLIDKCSDIVAIDFSLGSLYVLANRLPQESRVGLVHADITRLMLASQVFDRVLSTTSLDNREQRLSMNRIASLAMKPNGRFVFSAESFDLRTRLLGLPRARRYSPGGSYYYHMEIEDILREAAPYFRRCKARPIRAILPFSSGLGYMTTLTVSKIIERIPYLRNIGDLLLAIAEQPILPSVEGQPSSSGNSVVKALYNFYHRK